MSDDKDEKNKNVGSRPNLQAFYQEQHEKMINDFRNNHFGIKNIKPIYPSKEYLDKTYALFFKHFSKNIGEEICSKFWNKLENLDIFNIRVIFLLQVLTTFIKQRDELIILINFLQEIQEETLKLSNKTFKFQFLAFYIHLYLTLEDYDNAYKYCLETIKYIYKDVALYFYSALNVIFEKQNQTEALQNTQKIIKILINNKKLNCKNYGNIARYNSHLSDNTGDNKFLELANYFCKKVIKNTSDKHLKGELFSVISGFCGDLKKYYMSIGYGKIALKYTENKNTILDTNNCIATGYYYLAKYKNAIEIYQQIMKLDISDKAKIYILIAYCQKELGEIEAMKENIKKAYEIGSKDIDVQKEIEETYKDIERGKYDNSNDT